MTNTIATADTSVLRSKILAAGERITRHIVSDDEVPISYRLDLALEAMLAFSAVTGNPVWREHVDSVARRRGMTSEKRVPWRLEPFASLTWAIADARQDAAVMAGYVEETRAEVRDIWRSDDGLILHPRGESRGGGFAVLIDSFAEYASRTARAAAATGDLGLEEECADQVARHRAILRDVGNGLWSQGRGWLKDRGALSPGAWSRGQGWLMRGFASALLALPEDGPAYFAVRSVFQELADAVIAVQDSSGLWHALVHRPMRESAIETSGTGLMAGSIFRAVKDGHLPAGPYVAHAWRAAERLAEHVDEQGVVHDACYGPGPLEEEGPWLVAKFPPGDHHGPGTVLGCFAAALAMPVAAG